MPAAAGSVRPRPPGRDRRRRHRWRLRRASTPRASWPAAASPVTLLEAHTLGWGASTRNGGIVHSGYKWSAGELIKRYGAGDGRALYQETLDSYQLVKRLIADEAIDCDFREVGHLELAYAPSHVPELEHARAEPGGRRRHLARPAARAASARRSARTRTTAPSSSRAAGCSIPGKYFAGLAAAADRAGADLHEGVRATLDPAPGRRPLRRRDVPRRDPGPRRVRRHERLHGRRRPVAASPDHGHRLVHHRLRAAAGGPGPRAVAQRSLVLRHQELPVLLARVAGPPDGLRRPGLLPADLDRQDRPDPLARACSRSTRSWPTTASSTRGAATSASPSTGCRTSGGRRTASTYALGCCGTGVALMTYLGTRVGEWLAGGRGAGPHEAAVPASCRRRTRAGRGSCRSSASGIACRIALPRAPVPVDSPH